MIPVKKKSPEELAVLRQEIVSPSRTVGEPTPSIPLPGSTPDNSSNQLEIPSDPKTTTISKGNRLRKYELPLAPAHIAGYKTVLPVRRHDQGDIEQIRKRETISQLERLGQDQVARLSAQTASPFLCIPGYLLAAAGAVATYQRVHHSTPATLLSLSLLISVFIALCKPRSRHQAALIFIIVFLTTALGAIHYAPLFQHGP